MMKKVLAALLAVAMIFCLVACGDDKQQAQEGGEKKVKDTMTIVIESEGTDFDPINGGAAISSTSVSRNVYEGLVRTDANGNIIPLLATEWKMADDGMSITFKLREGVKFHNGEDFDADDVMYTWTQVHAVQRAKSETTFDFAHAEKLGQYEVKLPLLRKASDAINLLTNKVYSIYNQKGREAEGDQIGRKPVGTGPYKFDPAKWVVGDRFVLDAFEDYWGEQPAFKQITVRIIKESTQAQIELENGNVDAVVFNTGNDDVVRVLNGEVEGLETQPVFNGINVIFFNSTKEFSKNKLLRQAFQYAIDREALAKGDSLGLNTPAYQTVIPGYSGYIEDYNTNHPFPYDPDKAAQLVKDAGYPNGITLEMYSDAGKLAALDGQLLKNMLAKANININLHPLESGTFVPLAQAGVEDDLLISIMINDYYASPLMRFRMNVDNSFKPDWDQSAKTDFYAPLKDAFDKASNTTDAAELEKYFLEMNKLEVEESLVIPLNTMNIWVSSKKGLHIQWNCGDPNFSKWYFE